MNLNAKKYEMSYPLSSNDIHNMLDGQIKIIEYKDLYDINNINDVLKEFDACIILFVEKVIENTNIGHWCCIVKNNNKLCFFDPYGKVIDSEISDFYNNSDYYNGGQKRLIELFLLSKYTKFEYNDMQLQKMSKNINTCGRHCVYFIYCVRNGYTLDQYLKMMTNFKDKDSFVTFETNKMY
jgi:hypothetical protein